MTEEDTEKRFHSIMDKLFQSPKSNKSSSPGNQSSRGKKRGSSAMMSGRKSDLSNSGRSIVSLGGLNRSLFPIGSSSQAPICRPWDRGDLVRRLATFKSMTWFAKPKVVSAVNCARRGWINVEMDIIACEACGARLLFSTPSSWTQQQIEKAAAVFSLKLDSGHKLLCPWIDNSCDESLMQFPPTSAAALVDGYKERFSALLRLSALPVVSSSVVDYMGASQLEGFLQQSSVWEFGLGSVDATRIECVGRQPASGDLYYQALKLISLCGWEPRSLPYVVDCKDLSSQTTGKSYSKESSQIVNGQSPGITMYPISNADDEINVYNPFLSGQQSDPASVVLDCRLCGASVGLWAFSTVPWPLEFFRVTESSEGNNQNDHANLHSAGSRRTDKSNKEDYLGQNEGTMGTLTLPNERPLNLSIAGGPPPAKQNYRPIVSLPVISRHLRAGLCSNLALGSHVMDSVSSSREDTIERQLQITDSSAQEKDHTTLGEVIRQSEDMELLNYRGEDQLQLNHESHGDEHRRIEMNVDPPLVKGHTTPDAQKEHHVTLDECSNVRVDNPLDRAPEIPQEGGGNAEMVVENNHAVKEFDAIVLVSNGTIVNGEASHALDACSDFRVENPVASSQKFSREDGGGAGNAELGGENSSYVKECYAILMDSDDTTANEETSEMSTIEVCSCQLNEVISGTSPRHQEISSDARQESSADASCLAPETTARISCEMNLQNDCTGNNCQQSLSIQGTKEKCVEVRNITQHSVNNELALGNGLVKDLKQVESVQGMQFDPIRQHRHFCPWIVSTGKTAPGWQQTLSGLHRQRESSQPSLSENPSLSMLEVNDPIVSIRKLFTSPSAKRMKATHDSR